jgi:tRNA threonylcarbamoyladenosine biosynthesis protein TsaB
MKVLGIETATQVCGVGLAGEEGLLADYRIVGKTIHAEHLPHAVETVLKDAGVSAGNLDGIAVSIGPGSFTGLRIGLGVAKGLAFGLKKPLVAVPTMDGIVSQVPSSTEWACVLLIARKGEAYRGLYRWSENSWKIIDRYETLSETQVCDGLPDQKILFLGEGAACYREIIRKRIKRACFPPQGMSLAGGYGVASKGRELLKAGKTVDIDSLVPMYLKRFQGVA